MTARINEPWAMVPQSLADMPDVTLSDIKLYMHLDKMGGRSGKWYCSQQDITDATGIAERTLRESTARLVEHGYILTERLGLRYGTVLRYVVLARTQPVPEPDPPPLTDDDDTDRRQTAGSSGDAPPVARRQSAGSSGDAPPLSPILPTEVLRDHSHREQPPVSGSSPPPIQPPRSPALARLQREMHTRIGVTPPDFEWGIQFTERITDQDVDDVLRKAIEKGLRGKPPGRVHPWMLAVLQSVIEDREAGDGRDDGGASRGGAAGGGADPGTYGRGGMGAGDPRAGGARRGGGPRGGATPPPLPPGSLGIIVHG